MAGAEKVPEPSEPLLRVTDIRPRESAARKARPLRCARTVCRWRRPPAALGHIDHGKTTLTAAIAAVLAKRAGSTAPTITYAEITPRDPRCALQRGRVRAQKGDLGGAVADYEKLVASLLRTPRHSLKYERERFAALHELGLLRARKGDRAGAIADLEKFLELVPDDPNAPAARAELERLRKAKP